MHAILHPKHAASGYIRLPSPSQMASILLAHVSQATRGKSLFLDPSYQTTLHHTILRSFCCTSAVYYLVLYRRLG